ncbi:MAG: DUF2809 domain-containing protein [Planctomycetales bacterium]|nr:DUF2809 domain-containing protein [Planctomycetales bacterium]NIM07736.1 DUF2809 domain-containing protein [Planctomycetales bacterium]NIN07235.1 DUF2809 domain-containing protein [Planctomycetales bacterium]NIN76328.1 DUF2809 domain-containing protein [Planctomycetales bacterium]NIO33538.1 DUF2809 domain-containing protein [Planctomycetales bacterium]
MAAVVALGLGSRKFAPYLPAFVAQYAGDTLWALMVFLIFSLAAPAVPTSRRAAWALVVSYAVELSQLYQAPWIHTLRNTTLGGLVLGFGFLWSDIICYTVGVAAGAAIESILLRSAAKSSHPHHPPPPPPPGDN